MRNFHSSKQLLDFLAILITQTNARVKWASHGTREGLETREPCRNQWQHETLQRKMADDNLEFDLVILEAFSCVNFSYHHLPTLFWFTLFTLQLWGWASPQRWNLVNRRTFLLGKVLLEPPGPKTNLQRLLVHRVFCQYSKVESLIRRNKDMKSWS